MKRIVLVCLIATGCASTPEPVDAPPGVETQSAPPSAPKPAPRGGAFYKDDGPGENPPADLAAIPDAEPKREPLNRAASRPYVRFGKLYEPLATLQPFRQRGVASWYGRRFHGQKTSSGETYDMYAMSAAHPTLPIPSYARVTNLANGRSVVVRINDRGPFHSERIIDLSYTAAYKLGYASAGSAQVEVESIVPGETEVAVAPKPAVAAPAAAPAATLTAQSEGDKPAVQSGIFVQVGAFSSRENAEGLRSRIARQLSWLTDTVQVLASGNLWRLHIGPYSSNDAARSIAERIAAELNLKPLVVTR